MKLFFKIIIIAYFLSSCSNNKTPETKQAESLTTNMVDIATPDSITKTFVIPDSINTALIIATYVEIEPESHTLLIYDDVSKKTASLLRYLNDGKVTKEKLEVISENIFKKPATKEEYNVNDSSVVCSQSNGNNLSPKVHFRTDGNY